MRNKTLIGGVRMPFRKILLPILPIFILSLTACNKKVLLFDRNIYSVKTFLDSANCDTKCYETAQCEGKMVWLKGKLDQDNINRSHHQFYIIDTNQRYRIEVKVKKI